MKIIFAKHDGCGNKFCFELPENMKPQKNDILLVDTMYGPKIAVAVTSAISGTDEEMREVATVSGAYLPLKKVITYADENLIKYIQNQTCNSVMKFCAENFQNNTPGRYRGVEF